MAPKNAAPKAAATRNAFAFMRGESDSDEEQASPRQEVVEEAPEPPAVEGSIELKLNIFQSSVEKLAPGTRVRTNPPGKNAIYTAVVKEHHDDGSMTVLFGDLDLGYCTLPADHDVQTCDGEKGAIQKKVSIPEPYARTVLSLKQELFADQFEANKAIQFIVCKRVLYDSMTLDKWPLGVNRTVRVSITEQPRFDLSSVSSVGLKAFAETCGIRPVEVDEPGRYIVTKPTNSYVQADDGGWGSGRGFQRHEILEVVEVVCVAHISRIRGRVEGESTRWVSLLDLDSGERWAEALPHASVGDTVLILETKTTSLVVSGNYSEGYTLDGIDGTFGNNDIAVVEQAPDTVVMLQVVSREAQTMSVACLSLSGDELASLSVCDNATVADFRLQCCNCIGNVRVTIVLPDGRLLSRTDDLRLAIDLF